MKYQRQFALFLLIFLSVLGGYLLSYANFSQKLPGNLVGKNKVYAKESNSGLVSDNPNFAQLQKVFRAVPSKVLPSVVQINVSTIEELPAFPENLLFRFFGQPQRQGDNEPPREYRRQNLGSGTIIHQEGNTYYVLTNNHVIQSAEDISVMTYDEQKFPAEVVGNDSRVDLAIVRFEADEKLDYVAVAELGESSNLEIGDIVMAIGSPDGLQSTVTQGIVSYLGRRGGPDNNISDFVQTDASINKGNSGGPLVDMDGKVIGVNTWIASESGASAGLGFAIPIDNAKFVINSFLEKGELSYGWLGVSIPRYRQLVEQLGSEVFKDIFNPMGIADKKGSFITDVYNDSPAAKAGILPGDFVIELNGKPVASSDELTFMVGMLPPKEKARLLLIRNGAQHSATVTLGKRAANDQLVENQSQNWPGLRVLPLSKKINEALDKLTNGRLNSKENEGLLVIGVQAESATDVVGIQRGDVITEINGRRVRDLAEFYRELNKSDARNTIFTYKRKGYKLETPKIKLN